MREKLVLFIIPSLDIGGAQKIASFVANGCVANGYKVAVLAIEKGKYTVQLDPRISVHSICNEQTELINKGICNKLKVLYLIKRKVKELHADAIVVFGTMVQVYLALLGNKAPILGAERGDPNSYSKRTQKLIRYVYRHYKVLTFQTTMAKEVYRDIIGKNAFVIPNPCFLINNSKLGEKVKNRKKEIVSVGRLVTEKGYNFLIEAMIKLHQVYPEYKLIIYGEGPIREELENQIIKSGAAEYINLPGSIVGVENYISDASLFVLSSKYEGVPNTLLEAMALGVPVVACDCSPGGARFLTKNGTIGGPIVPYADVDLMYEKMKMMIENKEYAESMADKGLSVREEYAPSRIILMWLDAIKTLISE